MANIVILGAGDTARLAHCCSTSDSELDLVCSRGKQYRLGYAVSEDGIKWARRDSSVGIDVSDSGWDSEAVTYPFVFEHGGQQYMLYNGNGYGRTGFGIAERVPS